MRRQTQLHLNQQQRTVNSFSPHPYEQASVSEADMPGPTGRTGSHARDTVNAPATREPTLLVDPHKDGEHDSVERRSEFPILLISPARTAHSCAPIRLGVAIHRQTDGCPIGSRPTSLVRNKPKRVMGPRGPRLHLRWTFRPPRRPESRLGFRDIALKADVADRVCQLRFQLQSG